MYITKTLKTTDKIFSYQEMIEEVREMFRGEYILIKKSPPRFNQEELFEGYREKSVIERN